MDTSDSTNAENDVRGTFSYKESLIGSAFRGQSNFSIPEQEDFASDDDEEDEEEEDCPVIRLFMEEKKRIREPWRQTLIIKVLGRRVSYTFLLKRLQIIWKIQGDLNLVDLGNDFFLARFSNKEDRESAMSGGPWMVADHYLTMRSWHPNFNPNVATIEKVAVWIRLPDLAMEYYDNTVLWKIGNHIGKTLKVDRTTSVHIRGNYARICVEVDLTKPLLSKFKLRRRIRHISYEGLHMICFGCGQYGHKHEVCPYSMNKEGRNDEQQVSSNNEKGRDPTVPAEDTVVRPEVAENYGRWMVARRGAKV